MPPLYTAPQAAGLPTVPYLTNAEFKAAPTDIDTASLVPGGTQAQQDNALSAVIAQASSAMDAYVHYVLGATIDTDTFRARVRKDGYVVVPVRGIPILEIDSFSIGLLPSQMTTVSAAAAADAYAEDNVIFMPAIQSPTTPPHMSAYSIGDRVFTQYTYVNGYANTLLASAALQNATSISLLSALGVYPGTNLVIYDSGLMETVVVAPSYVSTTGPGPTSVPLVSGLLNAHSVGVSVSSLPPNVKKAAVLWTTALIKTRGAAGINLASIDEHPGQMSSEEGGGLEDIALAESMLSRYVLPTYI